MTIKLKPCPAARLMKWKGLGPYPKRGYTVARTYEECPENAYPDHWEEGDKLYTRAEPEEIAALRARIAELEAAQEWRPIEEAPRDGTRVVIANKFYKYAACWSARIDGWSDAAYGHVDLGFDPTHYFPLPQGPEE